jgi:aminomethyltransferase
MGQIRLTGAAATSMLEALVPGDIRALPFGKSRYTMFTNPAGGILDDLMVIRCDHDDLLLVVNAARKQADLEHLRAHRVAGVAVQLLEERALLALQGPQAALVLARLAPATANLTFLQSAALTIDRIDCRVTRSGYTGEDGFEISVPAAEAVRLAERLLASPEVAPIGLGARDSLRLEAGLCLYGADIDEETSPIEADLAWTLSRRRRQEGGFPGAAVLQRQLADGPARRRVGLKPDDRTPARAHTPITDKSGRPIGMVTSGGFGPSLGGPLAMGYVEADFAAPGSPVELVVRGTPRPAVVVALPFVAHRYVRQGRP